LFDVMERCPGSAENVALHRVPQRLDAAHGLVADDRVSADAENRMLGSVYRSSPVSSKNARRLCDGTGSPMTLGCVSLAVKTPIPLVP
jgi:hypothetical protein